MDRLPIFQDTFLAKAMSTKAELVFKEATEEWEFELIHRLNYTTFVEEIPQHSASDERRLVDKFHAENRYYICLKGRELAGMLAVRGNRPFSLDRKLSNLDSFLPAGRRVCEVRLLAIDKRYRGWCGGQIVEGFRAQLWRFGIEQGYDLLVISGTTRQLRLYRHLGFQAFGPMVGSGAAQYQPMYVALEEFEAGARRYLQKSALQGFHESPINFLPGPVGISEDVRRAFQQEPESHRSESFLAAFAETRSLLCRLVRASHVQILVGSGTLANDAVAAQLSLLSSSGLILSCGEFGDRLIDHARRFGLEFGVLRDAPDRLGNCAGLQRLFEKGQRPTWLWTTHCETSSGKLYDVEALKDLCREYGVRLCLDCISSIGTLPLDVSGCYLATATSGKGLGAYPGLALVFHHHDLEPQSSRLPRCLDLGYYQRANGIPFTLPSNLLLALLAAIKHRDWPRKFAEIAALSTQVRKRLMQLGLNTFCGAVSPAVVTWEVPRHLRATSIGENLEQAGFMLHFRSEYLQRLNRIQLCLMGELSKDHVVALLEQIDRCWSQKREGGQETGGEPHSVLGR